MKDVLVCQLNFDLPVAVDFHGSLCYFNFMRIYLDNCCFNRPFDDQSQI